jgi:hypothetical protein
MEILKARAVEEIAWSVYTHYLAVRDENPSEVTERLFAEAERAFAQAQFSRRLAEGDADAQATHKGLVGVA